MAVLNPALQSNDQAVPAHESRRSFTASVLWARDSDPHVRFENALVELIYVRACSAPCIFFDIIVSNYLYQLVRISTTRKTLIHSPTREKLLEAAERCNSGRVRCRELLTKNLRNFGREPHYTPAQADAKMSRRIVSINLAKPMETVGQYPFVLCAWPSLPTNRTSPTIASCTDPTAPEDAPLPQEPGGPSLDLFPGRQTTWASLLTAVASTVFAYAAQCSTRNHLMFATPRILGKRRVTIMPMSLGQTERERSSSCMPITEVCIVTTRTQSVYALRGFGFTGGRFEAGQRIIRHMPGKGRRVVGCEAETRKRTIHNSSVAEDQDTDRRH